MAQSSGNSDVERYDLWDRVGYVELKIGDDEPMVFKGLDFKFNVRKVLANRFEGTMKVEIHGLTQKTANKIVTVCNQQEASMQRKLIRVYAGYRKPEDPNYEGTLIGAMDILYASVTSPPPEMWITIEGVMSKYYDYFNFGFRTEGQKYEVTIPVTKKIPVKVGRKTSLAGVSVYGPTFTTTDVYEEREFSWKEYETRQDLLSIDQVCEEFQKALNQSFIMHDMKNRLCIKLFVSEKTREHKVPEFEFKDKLSAFPTKLGEVWDVFCFFDASYGDEDYLIVVDKNMDTEGKSKEERSMAALNHFKPTIKFKKLDVEHGLIGIPTVYQTTSLKCRCLLDPDLTVGDFIQIESRVMEAVKGTDPERGWQIMSIGFNGHMRGNNWYTDITAVDLCRMAEIKKSSQSQNQPKIHYL